MTKYIDRYYLNGELYGIKFAGGGGGWQPGANTILYLPLISDVNDYSGNNHTCTNNGVTFTTSGTDMNVGYFYGNSIQINDAVDLRGSNSNTWSFWWKSVTHPNPNGAIAEDFVNKGMDYTAGGRIIRVICRSNGYDDLQTKLLSNNTNIYASSGVANSGMLSKSWKYVVVTWDGTYIKTYVNSVLKATGTASSGTYGYTNTSPLNIGFNENGYPFYLYGYLSNVIYEGVTWTQQEIQDYFDQTKSLYGIS